MLGRTGQVEVDEPSSPPADATLLFTDIQGSTGLLDRLGHDRYAEVLLQHQRAVRTAIAAHHGTEQGTEGDSFFVTFPTAADGVAAALDAQRALAAARWPGDVDLRVRMGLHHGPVAMVGGNLVGMAIHAAARIEAAAHGGQVVASAAVVDRLSRTSVEGDLGWRPLGAHRLRGIVGRVELFQAEVPGLPHQFPPLRTEPSDAAPVPRWFSEFVGRAGELDALRPLLERHRVVTITGPPGVGKTRLASALVDQLLDVAFVDLAPVADPAHVTDRIAASVGVDAGGDEGAIDAVARSLAEVPYVLLVDNCEHLIDEVAAVVGELTRRARSLRVVATSREPLAIDGEVVWPLEPLLEAEELFVVRVRDRDATSTLTAGDPRVVAICERVDRLPLAVELAAAQVARMPIDEVVARIDDLPVQLRSARRDVPARHRTLLGAIEWSVRLLDAAEQRALRRLAVLRGPFDLATAEAVTGEPPDVVVALHERSLLTVDDRASGRMRMLQTVRDVATELLDDAGESSEVRDHHARAFLTRARDRLRTEGAHMLPFDEVDAAAADYEEAVGWLAEHDPPAALELAIALDPLWTTRMFAMAATRVLDRVLAAAPEPAELRASTLLILADVARNAGWMDDARRAAEEARDLVVEDVVRRDRFPARVVLGQILAMQGEIDRALGLFEEHLEVSRRLGDPVGVVTALREIANVAIERLRPDEAIEPLAEASEVAASHEDARWILGLLASDRARVALQLGRVEEARAEYEASLASAQALGVLRGVAGCGIGLSHVGRMAGEAEAARPLLRDSLRYYLDQGDSGGVAHVWVEAALVHSAGGRHDVAVELLAAADVIRARMGIATPGSEAPEIAAARSAALTVLGAEATARGERQGRVASIEELAALV